MFMRSYCTEDVVSWSGEGLAGLVSYSCAWAYSRKAETLGGEVVIGLAVEGEEGAVDAELPSQMWSRTRHARDASFPYP